MLPPLAGAFTGKVQNTLQTTVKSSYCISPRVVVVIISEQQLSIVGHFNFVKEGFLTFDRNIFPSS